MGYLLAMENIRKGHLFCRASGRSLPVLIFFKYLPGIFGGVRTILTHLFPSIFDEFPFIFDWPWSNFLHHQSYSCKHLFLNVKTVLQREISTPATEGCPILWHSWFFVIDITKCPLILNKIVTVLQCMKNGTLCDTLWSTVNLIMSEYWTCMWLLSARPLIQRVVLSLFSYCIIFHYLKAISVARKQSQHHWFDFFGHPIFLVCSYSSNNRKISN